MRKLLSWIALSLIGTAVSAQAPADLQATLLASSKGTYTALQKGDKAALLSLLTQDFTFVGKEGIFGGSDLDGILSVCKLTSFDISEPRLQELTPDSVVLIYKVKQVAACEGKPEPPTVTDTDTFIRKDGRWLISIHTETPAL